MRFINKSECQFLTLLKYGLWGNVQNTSILDHDIDWAEISKIARSQTVTGIIFDAFELIPIKPDRATIARWVWDVKEIEDANIRINLAVVDIVSRFCIEGLEPILMKGQAVGQYYRKPLHRQPGDIDLYFPKGYEYANELMEGLNAAIGHEETTYHKSFSINDVEIENHSIFVDFYDKKNAKKWERVYGELFSKHMDIFQLKNREGEAFCVKTFTPQMNSIYLYLHLQHHLLQTGIGLRQVCDWACLWKDREKEIDKELFLKVVESLPIKRCMTALTWIMVNYLGLPYGVIPLDTTGKQAEKDGELLLRDILDSGNFGRSSGVMDGFVRNNHWNNIKNYALALKRMIKLRRLCPSEVDAYIKYWISDKLS